MDLKDKTIAQFCCNNGRELLSLCSTFGAKGTGFDIADNLIEQANKYVKELQLPCTFISNDILEISECYNASFDVVLFTIGAITWFEHLDDLFQVVSRCLKPGGLLVLHDFHPIVNMLPMPGEDAYQEYYVALMEHTYFSKEPWIETNGMPYMSGTYDSETFTSFSHTVSDIINASIQNQLTITSFDEFDYDVGMSEAYDGKGLPLSFLMLGVKNNMK